jgi:hypothetical protein
MERGYCVIPMSVLIASPFTLGQGDLVVVRMSASNIVGTSLYSNEAADGSLTYADIRTVPHTPPHEPTRGPLSSTDTIEVVITELTEFETGGDGILSYHIEYDGGTQGATWTELQGYTSNSLALSVVQTGLTMSTAYRVRYRARN